ncbi:Rpn family recombination-promoting nuclease/putative transposase [Archangium gephyra]|uniref:Rpn family recombination-promoting nuclease/putative transposase n=1 Tax=Archangium gephyra TaxID=48 RepID=UPI0035D4EDC5
MSGPHDRFIRYVLEHSERAAALLHALLPPGFAARVDWSTLRSHPTALVDSAIRETRGDLSFSVQLRGSSRRAFILLEHQSRVEGRMAARMRQYVSRLIDQWEQQHPRGGPQPLILPVVLYHGPRGPWTAPRRLEELLKISLEEARREGWLKHLLRLEYVLYDLMTHSERELKRLACPPLVRLALVLLRLASTRQLNRRLMQQVDLFREVYASPQGPRELEAVIRYLRDGAMGVTCEVIRQLLGCLVMRERRSEREHLMWASGRQLRAEGRRMGLAEGQARGIAKGTAQAVLRILAARGVRVDDKSRQRLRRCTDLATLDRWFERALHAHSLSDVLDEPVTSSQPGRRAPGRRSPGSKKAVPTRRSPTRSPGPGSARARAPRGPTGARS